jgi:hypothetical protein
MARPDYLICLECEAEVEDFIWRDGEIRRAACEVCGNTDADAFSLPEDFQQDLAAGEDETDEDEGSEGDQDLADYNEYPDDEDE